jgi:OOP family OmpA-OmpF porin
MKKILLSSILCMMFSAPAFAGYGTPVEGGYLRDGSGNVVKSGTGLCIITSATFSPEAECGDVIQQHKPKLDEAPKPKLIPMPETNIHDVEAVGIVLQSSFLFKFDSAKLSKEGEEALTKQVVAVNPHTVEIIGHTDQLGTQIYNLKLSKKRAESVKAFLVSQGIDEKTITTIGMGETQLLCEEKHPKKSSACSEKNRRVEIKATTFNK